MTASTWACGAGGVDDPAQLGDLVGGEVGAERAVEQRGVGGGGGVEGEGDQHGALALDQVVAGRLAGGGRVAEDAEQVVAELERLAEREAERPSARAWSPPRRRRARRRCAAAARWSTSRTCSAARSSRRRRRRGRGPARRRRGTGRRSPPSGTGRRRRAPARPRRSAGRSGAAARRTSSAAGRRAGSPRRRRTAPGRRATRPRGARARRRGASRAGRDGCRRRPCSRRGRARWRAAARARRRRGPGRPRRPASARRRGGPSSRTTRGTSCRRRPTSAPRRPAGRRRGRAAPAAPACSSRKSSSAAWTRSRKPALSHPFAVTRTRLASGQRRSAAGPVPRLLRMANARSTEDRRPDPGGRAVVLVRVLPAQDEAGEAQLWQAIRELEPYRPTFVSVTYGAGGSTRDTHGADHRPDRARDLADPDGPPDLRRPHPRRSSRASSTRTPTAGIQQRAWCCAATRPRVRGRSGRRPRAGSPTPASWSSWPAARGDFSIGVAAFPEGHPSAESLDPDADVLVAKARAGRGVRGDPDVLPGLRLLRAGRAGPRPRRRHRRSCRASCRS